MSERARCGCASPVGFCKRIVAGTAERLGWSTRGVWIALIAALLLAGPLAFWMFVAMWLWVDCADALRRQADALRDWWWRGGRRHRPVRTAEIDPAPSDPFMNDLKESFADLDRRAGAMEGYVTSATFKLDQEFRRMKSD